MRLVGGFVLPTLDVREGWYERSMPTFAKTLALFDDNRASLNVVPDDRPIARNPPPPKHKPTSEVPDSLAKPLSPEVRRRLRERTSEVVGSLERTLGKPFFAKDGFILYNHDCVAAMQAIAKSELRFDLTVTSPPYNIGKAYESPMAVEEYVDWSVKWIDAVHSVSAANAAFWLNLGYLHVPGKGRCVPISYLLWDKTPFHLIQEVVWNYGAGVTSKRFFAPRNEKWLFYVSDPESYVFNLDAVRDPNVKYPNQKKNGKFRCNPLGKNPSDVWQFPKVTTGTARSSKERTGHPAQFPLGVVERVIRVSSNPGDLVLEPFSGSGSAGVATVATGRVFVGFELSKDYCRISSDRFKRHLDRLDPLSSMGRAEPT